MRTVDGQMDILCGISKGERYAHRRTMSVSACIAVEWTRRIGAFYAPIFLERYVDFSRRHGASGSRVWYPGNVVLEPCTITRQCSNRLINSTLNTKDNAVRRVFVCP
ncbi:hypothetical protein EVAR_22269_1 [Eumeta japonica]|uniref:Uncharacterized protein n=1 Tax=Eumeta variegata TaxID=151549 RepID=A0A4C1UBA5_EUMVA|nr:hypothetical protein EVAR_22269_1 [Eumeta japonica]